MSATTFGQAAAAMVVESALRNAFTPTPPGTMLLETRRPLTDAERDGSPAVLTPMVRATMTEGPDRGAM